MECYAVIVGLAKEIEMAKKYLGDSFTSRLSEVSLL